MSPTQQLQQLKELPDPPLPAFWPQTWGWWALLALILLATAMYATHRYRRYRANAYRRQALAELNQVLIHWQAAPGDISPLRDIPGLLKRTALARLGPEHLGTRSMGGDDWQQLLQRMSSAPLPADFAAQLGLLAYADDRAVQQLDLALLYKHCRLWLETHHDPV